MKNFGGVAIRKWPNGWILILSFVGLVALRVVSMLSIKSDELGLIWWNCRGNTPFCSEECRQQQIDIDEAEEKRRDLSMKVASRKEQQQEKSSSKPKNNCHLHVRTRTLVAG